MMLRVQASVFTIVELHGGQIVCKSEPNEYTQFVFWLPNV